VRMQGVYTGSSSAFASILLGVLDGATVKGRIASNLGRWSRGTPAATDFNVVGGVFTVDVTPSTSYTWDAAYGVELAAASTGLKWGGPDNNSGANAWGGFAYEIWAA